MVTLSVVHKDDGNTGHHKKTPNPTNKETCNSMHALPILQMKFKHDLKYDEI